MDIQTEKYALIEYITKITDVKLIKKLKDFVKASEKDFWNELTDAQRKEILQGMDELDRGEKIDYEQFMSKYR
ncbi:hypothetical protein MM236_15065 [Belliella sp. DSM 107340]|uniref:Addiction module component n=1 Tax=Belliella calami TaxID=2923436 RepID=A0ABS9URR5_9BACT|nr:hypothetical protein [Belliella calami]MCH7399320.1 hypothetical protein [Belliella calami]